ncbi:ABC transporter permease [Microbispora triticiradicis]|uniref:ABC transporter permease n=1 Tax=Microbispora triticiradicis TaxID=2200763 RepID=UPI001AD70332|nr:ABC transporter permease subunit [Microbispora triticiradicis]MBO4269194.1 ABC transporter permease [Microbispora triticiradicis]
MSTTRIRAIFRKELREYRRNRQIVTTMAVLPLLFTVYPIIEIFALPASAAGALAHRQPLVFMLAIPAIVPGTVAAYSVAGERRQGTLEPVLTTPIRAEEFLVGKALAALVPSLVVSYGVFAFFVAAVELLAQPAVASAVLHGPEVLAQLLFTPPVAALSIWVGTAISSRSSDPRVAAQLSTVASIPAIVVTTTIAVGGIHATLRLAVLLGAALLIIDVLAWRVVSPMFDRERLITGAKS